MAVVLEKKTTVNGTTVWVAFPTPTEITYTRSAVDSSASGRNQAGYMFRDVVGQKTKLQVKWGALTNTQVSTVLQMVDEPFLMLRYPDAYTGAKREMECYVGDRSSPIYRMDSDSVWKWKELSFSFIER